MIRSPQASRRVDAPDPPFVRATGSGAAIPIDAWVAPPKPTMIARRQPSRAPKVILGIVGIALVATAAAIGFMHRDEVASFFPHGPSCPEGMVAYPAGPFLFGSERTDPDRDFTEAILHEESVGAFCIDRYEYPNVEGQMPLTSVTWTDASAACEKQGKRLCSEDEWERACKGPGSKKFPFGDVYQKGVCNIAPSVDSPGSVAKIGSFSGCGQADGPRDMVGNAAELTATAWSEDATQKVVKGGSAKLPPAMGRCAFRDGQAVDDKRDDVGFRCCWSQVKPIGR